MSRSVLQTEKECFYCGSPYVEKHHLYKSHKCRKAADREGLWVWLCHEHHTGQIGVHNNREKDLELMKAGQLIYEQTHTREEFRENFIKSYL